jgi:hypothetical protein
MRSDIFRESSRRALGIDRPDPGGMCCATACTQEMTAQHAYSCNGKGQFTWRHHRCVQALKTVLEGELGLAGILHESTTCFKAGNTQDRMDLVVPGGQLLSSLIINDRVVPAHKGLMIDFTHSGNTGKTHRKFSATHNAGAVAERSAAGKHTKYQGHFYSDSYHLIPIAVETSGAMAVQSHEAISCFARHMSIKSSGAWTVSQCVARVRQQLSIALHTALSESTAKQFAECTPPGGAGTTRPNLYLDVRLLQPPV